MIRLAWLIPLLPLAGAALLGAIGRRLGERAVGAVAIGSVALAFVLSVSVVFDYVTNHHGEHADWLTCIRGSQLYERLMLLMRAIHRSTPVSTILSYLSILQKIRCEKAC